MRGGRDFHLIIKLFSPQVVAASSEASSTAASLPEGLSVRSGASEAVPVCSSGLEPPGHHAAEERAEGPQPLACPNEGGWERVESRSSSRGLDELGPVPISHSQPLPPSPGVP